jgi:drug/metabolite transporter (DMT)-like permease
MAARGSDAARSDSSMEDSGPRERRLAYLAWIAVCRIWGTTYLGIRITLETIPPWLMSGMRWIVAGSILGGAMLIRGERLPSASAWRGALFLGITLLVLGNGGVVWAEQYVPSGLAAVIVAASPFWMAGIELFLPDGEKLTFRTIVGLALGFAGILLLVWPDMISGTAAGRGFVVGVIALQVACLGWSVGSSYSRRHARAENIFMITAAQMLAGGVMMLALGTLQGEWPALRFSARTAGALAYLATIGALGGFVAYTYALRHLPLSLVSLYAYINPVIAVALGVTLMGEPFNSRMAVAAALVFGGVAIVSRPSKPDEPGRNQTPEEEAIDGPMVRTASAPGSR